MLTKFLQCFNEKTMLHSTGDLYADIMTQLGGKQFGEGLFNLFSAQDVQKWEKVVSEAFPAFRGKFRLFGYDWLGRCYGVHQTPQNDEDVLLFDVESDEIMTCECSLDVFLNEVIPSDVEDCFAKPFFDEWKAHDQAPIPYGWCVGFRIPLLLGGTEEVENMELCDMDVYWTILGQIRKQI